MVGHAYYMKYWMSMWKKGAKHYTDVRDILHNPMGLICNVLASYHHTVLAVSLKAWIQCLCRETLGIWIVQIGDLHITCTWHPWYACAEIVHSESVHCLDHSEYILHSAHTETEWQCVNKRKGSTSVGTVFQVSIYRHDTLWQLCAQFNT